MYWNLLHILFTDINKNCSMVLYMTMYLNSIKLNVYDFSHVQVPTNQNNVPWFAQFSMLFSSADQTHTVFIHEQLPSTLLLCIITSKVSRIHIFVHDICSYNIKHNLLSQCGTILIQLTKRRSSPILLLIIYFLKMLHQICWPFRKKSFHCAFFGSV